MSYDIWTEPNKDNPIAVVRDDVYGVDWNYTYNIQPMTEKAGLRSLTLLDGVDTEVAELALTTVIARMEADTEGYRVLNPKNRWGDYDGFLKALRELRDGLAQATDSVVRVG